MAISSPVYIKHGLLHKLTVVKAYKFCFVSLSVKAVNVELVYRCLHRYIKALHCSRQAVTVTTA